MPMQGQTFAPRATAATEIAVPSSWPEQPMTVSGNRCWYSGMTLRLMAEAGAGYADTQCSNTSWEWLRATVSWIMLTISMSCMPVQPDHKITLKYSFILDKQYFVDYTKCLIVYAMAVRIGQFIINMSLILLFSPMSRTSRC